MICNNCGKQGHMFHQCKMPITSYGVIVYRKRELENVFEYLMIRRKDSFGYIDFLRGKYSPFHVEQLVSIVDQMSTEEKEKIQTHSFETMWREMWGAMTKSQYKSEEIASNKKFDQLKNGIFINKSNSVINLEDIVKLSTTSWAETEWEFPKGRRNHQEKDVDCALREFEEETGILQANVKIIENLMPFEETFLGTNFKSYKHKYFLATLEEANIGLDTFQASEVSKMEWKTLEECLAVIRPYNQEKKQLIININNVLQKYKVF